MSKKTLKLDERSLFQILHLDLPLLLAIFAVSIISFVVLYSASGQEISIIERQLVRFGLAITILFLIAQIHPRHFQTYSPWMYAIGLILLILVLTIGDHSKGAQRWLDLGFVRFQPSEIMKFAVPMMVAWYLKDKSLPPTLKEIAIVFLLIAIPVLLIAKQPDLGTALIIAASGTIVILLAGISFKLVFSLCSLGALLLPVLWHFMHDYQRQRVLTLFNPERDPLGSGYHIIQSNIAIGSGGLFGKGWTLGTQSGLKFLPERTTDFIFAVLAEEFGFIGVMILLALYAVIIGRGLYIGARAQNTYNRLLAGSITISFFVYAFVNIGMVSGILPVVGLPLPLLSYGGTSLLTLAAGFGMLMAIHTNKQLLSR